MSTIRIDGCHEPLKTVNYLYTAHFKKGSPINVLADFKGK